MNRRDDWTGKGKVQARRAGETVLVRVDAMTTQARRFKRLVGDFFRKDFRQVRPRGGPFAVRILIEMVEDTRGHDVDNVAKALLDALTGHVFYDDSQVVRLLIEKAPGPRARIHLSAGPCARPDGADFEGAP